MEVHQSRIGSLLDLLCTSLCFTSARHVTKAKIVLRFQQRLLSEIRKRGCAKIKDRLRLLEML